MRVQVLHVDGCPNAAVARDRTRAALDALGLDEVPVETVLVGSESESEAVVFAGSPTILVDGADLFPTDGRTRDLACRIYPTAHGLAGSPTRAQIESAIALRRA